MTIQSLCAPPEYDPYVLGQRLYLTKWPLYMIGSPPANMNIFRHPGPVPYNVFSMEFKKQQEQELSTTANLKITFMNPDLLGG